MACEQSGSETLDWNAGNGGWEEAFRQLYRRDFLLAGLGEHGGRGYARSGCADIDRSWSWRKRVHLAGGSGVAGGYRIGVGE